MVRCIYSRSGRSFMCYVLRFFKSVVILSIHSSQKLISRVLKGRFRTLTIHPLLGRFRNP